MKIGVPKEIKIHEYRVGLVPAGVAELVNSGHQVLVQSGAGAGIGFEDAHYREAGANVAPRAKDVFAAAELIVKVKEPQLPECRLLRPGQTLFTYLHLAADRKQAQALIASGATAIAYETVTAPDGSLPLLTPMSEVAGRMSVQVGANCLQKANGGFGVLLGGGPGVPLIGTVGRIHPRKDLVTFIHVAEMSSFLESGRRFGPHPLSPDQCDRYYAEVAPVATSTGSPLRRVGW